MRIAIIGGGASGLYSAILLQKKHQDAEIVVFEKETKIGRKLYATGNGHCNLLNAAIRPEAFNDPAWIAPYLKRYPFSSLEKTLNDWGVETLHEGDYVYPLSYSAATYVGFLTQIATGLGVKFVPGVRVLDYQAKASGFCLKTDANPSSIDLVFDKIVIAVGGASSPKLGSDGKSVSFWRLHGYDLVPFEPGLAPLKILHPDILKGMAGYRHEARVRLLSKEGKALYEEEGEVLFKEDGLSGIVIFNVESAYLRLGKPIEAEISLDLFPHEKEEELAKRLSNDRKKNPSFYLDAYLPKDVQAHFRKGMKGDEASFLASKLKDDRYLISGVYGFDSSQVSIGGVRLSEVDAQLQSRREKGVYFVGEALNIDGFCGGFNLSWALLSALILEEGL